MEAEKTFPISPETSIRLSQKQVVDVFLPHAHLTLIQALQSPAHPLEDILLHGALRMAEERPLFSIPWV